VHQGLRDAVEAETGRRVLTLDRWPTIIIRKSTQVVYEYSKLFMTNATTFYPAQH
jgi:hypothetical protein